MKLSRIIIIIGGLLLASPALHAQDFLQKAKNYLDAGDCEKAQMAYDAYKVENPEGNEEVEQGIAKCLHADELTQTTLYMNEGKYVGEDMNGRPSGQGTYYWADGDVDKGTWVDDKRNGSFIRTTPSGKKSYATYSNGEMTVSWHE